MQRAYCEEVCGCQRHGCVIELPREADHVRQQQPSLSWRELAVKGIVASPAKLQHASAQLPGLSAYLTYCPGYVDIR